MASAFGRRYVGLLRPTRKYFASREKKESLLPRVSQVLFFANSERSTLVPDFILLGTGIKRIVISKQISTKVQESFLLPVNTTISSTNAGSSYTESKFHYTTELQ